MDLQDWIDWMRAELDDVDVLVASEESGVPEAAWGDVFVSHRDGGSGFPFATIVTRDQPGSDERSRLDRSEVFRVNVGIGRTRAIELLGPDWRDTDNVDMAAPDHLFAHPVYAAQGFVSVVTPGPDTTATVKQLLREAHAR